MPANSSADPFILKWGYGLMSTIALALPMEDFQHLEETGLVKRVFRHYVADGLTLLLLNAKPAVVAGALRKAGLSCNYAVFPTLLTMTAREKGQLRYGHDGTVLVTPLFPDLLLADQISRLLPGDRVLSDAERYQLCLVACGTESWDNRHENGQMYKLRCLLSD